MCLALEIAQIFIYFILGVTHRISNLKYPHLVSVQIIDI